MTTDQGVSILSNIVGQRNVQTRFRVDNDTWPPDQPKNFTPLTLIYYEGHRNVQQVMATTKLTQTGDIALLASNQPVPKHQPLQEVLDISTVTKKVEQIVVPLEKNNGPQFILIEGPPGIGKSVLLKEIAYRWGDKQILRTFKFVLLIFLRDPIVQQTTSVHDLLQLFCVGHKRAPVIIDACNEHLFENGGKDLVFLLDGFDELPEGLQKNGLVSQLLERHVLPNCGLIISSRPHASENLRKQATLRVDILGFTETERVNYLEQALPHAVKELTEYLESNLTINGLCFIPFNMVILIYLYKQGIPFPNNSTQLYNYFICLTICRHLAKSGHPLDNTITDLAKLPEPHNTLIEQLSKLSLEGLNNNKLIFTLEEMKTICPDITAIPDALNGFGLLQAIQHFGLAGKTMTFNFVHVSIQEFLAAYHITQLPHDKVLQVLEEKFWSNLHSNMFAMYTSLTKGQQSAFKQFLSGRNNTELPRPFCVHHPNYMAPTLYSVPSPLHYLGSRDGPSEVLRQPWNSVRHPYYRTSTSYPVLGPLNVLDSPHRPPEISRQPWNSVRHPYYRASILYSAPHSLTSLGSPGRPPEVSRSNKITIDGRFLEDKLKCLQLFRCFHEANDEAYYTSIQKQSTFSKGIDLRFSKLSVYDIECVTLFLTFSPHKEWEKLNFEACYIQDLGFRILHRNLKHCDVTIRWLELSYNGLTRSSSSSISDLTIHCKVEVLKIRGNDTIGDDPALYNMLSHPASRLVRLYMRGTSLSSSSAIALFTALAKGNKLQELYFLHTAITDETCNDIIASLKNNTSLVGLEMYDNEISAKAAQRLVQALQCNDTLRWLQLPHYNEDVKKTIRSLGEEVHKSRKGRGCQTKLVITHGDVVL